MSFDHEASKAFVRRLPLFADLPDEDLDAMCQMAQAVAVPAGHVLMREGEPGDTMYVILAGEFEVIKRSGDRDVIIARRGVGDVIGEMALLYDTPRVASVRAVADSRVIAINQTAFSYMLAHNPAAPLIMLHTVTSRLRNIESLLLQHEKLAALGTLAAGLAHELNNPAAAARRSAAQIEDALAEWERLTLQISALHLTHAQLERLEQLRRAMEEHDSRAIALDSLAQSDREAELESALDDYGVGNAWAITPVLVAAGWHAGLLNELVDDFEPDHLPVVVRWLAAVTTAATLAREVQISAEQISQIVTAIKTYSYLDQAPIQQVDVHASLENTLVMLRHKLRQGIRVTREYSADLPRIEAYGSELNQVWTNLIDNAIDAMQGEGEIRLRTARHGEQVAVEISDTGPGIPDDLRSRIFEPFFTTKPPGVGSGLGLHIVYNIVVQKHGGNIEIVEQPRGTCFRVTLPMRLSSSR